MSPGFSSLCLDEFSLEPGGGAQRKWVLPLAPDREFPARVLLLPSCEGTASRAGGPARAGVKKREDYVAVPKAALLVFCRSETGVVLGQSCGGGNIQTRDPRTEVEFVSWENMPLGAGGAESVTFIFKRGTERARAGAAPEELPGQGPL